MLRLFQGVWGIMHVPGLIFVLCWRVMHYSKKYTEEYPRVSYAVLTATIITAGTYFVRAHGSLN
jgi:hypothetical protein